MDSRDNFDNAARDAGQRATEAARKAREYAAGLVQQQKQRAASGISQFGSAIRETAGRMQDDKDATLAGYADAAAAKLEGAASYLESRDVNTMLTDAQSFARRRPELVIGGMFVAGVTIARFLKASGPAATESSSSVTDDFVPQSKRHEPKLGGSAADRLLHRVTEADSQNSGSPRGVNFQKIDDATSAARRVEAAGGEIPPESNSPQQRMESNPPIPKPEAQ